ncbi:protein tyrosine phosphatase family protein [Xanthomonas melonis]|uniref:Protein tyrosine phosphatase family protein n=3 Tax=Xanthomonas TaxID=338 RepID=A0ABS8NSV4_9XANT|nr:protein tyrosine phosphatase family protein [Xanthomonas melonis]MCD0257924.1 protein tyrosine phosphatase family protein [Xanthomonas melonis]MCD0266143.1 protein tyrosine phosphatase family protein [Xanthomonas melonis]MCD0279460.1 protein tyrosine phosphatase family protein [Xanthomonas melonis]
MRRRMRHALWMIALLGDVAAAQTAPAWIRHDVLTSGQPTPAQLRAAAADGVTTVIDLRAPDEPRGYDEARVAESLGLRYVRLPIRNADALTPEAVRALRRSLNQQSRGQVLLHCASGNRVGALVALLAARDGASTDQALQLGRNAGMQPSLEPAVRRQLDAAPQR